MCVEGQEGATARGMAEELKPFGLTPVEFFIIRRCMEAEDGSTATQLARFQSTDSSQVSRGLIRFRNVSVAGERDGSAICVQEKSIGGARNVSSNKMADAPAS